jgi:hypothetical protein
MVSDDSEGDVMSDIGEMLRHAYQLDDEAHRDFEQYQERKRRDNPLLTKSAHQGLVYKTFETPRPTAQAAKMSEEDSRSWNDWFAAGFRNFAAIERKWVSHHFEVFAAIIGEETGKVDAKLLAKIKTLEADVAVLRADLESLRAHKTPVDVSLKDVVTPLRSAR